MVSLSPFALALAVALSSPISTDGQLLVDGRGLFSYVPNADNGPALWPTLNTADPNECAGLKQSPISLTASYGRCDLENAEYVFDAGDCETGDLDFFNNDHSVEAAYPADGSCQKSSFTMPKINGRYEIDQLHIHSGSEHALEGNKADFELHAVHRLVEGTGSGEQEGTNLTNTQAVYAIGMNIEGTVDNELFWPLLNGWKAYVEEVLTSDACADVDTDPTEPTDGNETQVPSEVPTNVTEAPSMAPSEANTTVPTPTPSEIVEPTPTPTEAVEPTPEPSEAVDPTPAPSEQTDSTPAPSEQQIDDSTPPPTPVATPGDTDNEITPPPEDDPTPPPTDPEGTTRKLQEFNVYALVPETTTGYYHYDGSLTTPACTEDVWWTIADRAMIISEAQGEELRKLILDYRDPDTCELATGANPNDGTTARPVQDLNGRTVRVYCLGEAEGGTDAPLTEAPVAQPTTSPPTTPAPTLSSDASRRAVVSTLLVGGIVLSMVL